MIYLLKRSGFSAEQNGAADAWHSKFYQHIEMQRVLAQFHGSVIVGEIGCQKNFQRLLEFTRSHRFIIDPYNGAHGGGLSTIPDLPYPIALFRCMIGTSEGIIPPNFFDLTFSLSVIEHVGQAETGNDRQPVEPPPAEQEGPRRRFCSDLFRITRPGGVTVHTVDHAARNRTFVQNFLDAGFQPLVPATAPTLKDCMDDPDNVVHMRKWGRDSHLPATLEDRRLDGVILMGFRKPA